MFWFVPYRFSFPSGVNAPDRIRAALADPKWQHSISEHKITIWRKLPAMVNNSWNPIFEGRLVHDAGRYELKGYFRPLWIVLAINIAIFAVPLYEIWSLLGQPDVRPGYVEGWKERQMEWNITFLAAVTAITGVGWLFGVPHQKRILKVLTESSCA